MNPLCPNHQCELTPTDNPVVWICPMSDARFGCDVDNAEKTVSINAHGELEERFEVVPLDGEE